MSKLTFGAHEIKMPSIANGRTIIFWGRGFGQFSASNISIVVKDFSHGSPCTNAFQQSFLCMNFEKDGEWSISMKNIKNNNNNYLEAIRNSKYVLKSYGLFVYCQKTKRPGNSK